MGEREVQNLYLTVINDPRLSPFGSGLGREISLSLVRKKWARKYDPTKAAKAYQALTDAAAKDNVRQFDEKGSYGQFGRYSPTDRKRAADELRGDFERRVKTGELDSIFPQSLVARRSLAPGVTAIAELKAHGIAGSILSASGQRIPVSIPASAKTVKAALDAIEKQWKKAGGGKPIRTSSGMTIPQVTERTRLLNELDTAVRNQERDARAGKSTDASRIIRLRDAAIAAGASPETVKARLRKVRIDANEKIDKSRRPSKTAQRKATAIRRKVLLRRLGDATSADERRELATKAEAQHATNAEIHRALAKSQRASQAKAKKRIVTLKRDLRTLIVEQRMHPDDYRVRGIIDELKRHGVANTAELVSLARRTKPRPTAARPAPKGPQPESGYAYRGSNHITGANWRKSKDAEWEIMMLSPERAGKIDFLGTRSIDGSRVNVWRIHDPMLGDFNYYAQQK